MAKLGRRHKWQIDRFAVLRSAEQAALALPPPCADGDELIVDLERCAIIEPYALALVACHARRLADSGVSVTVSANLAEPSNRFAISMGIRDFLEGHPRRAGEPERTIPLTGLRGYPEMDAFSRNVAQRVAKGDEEVRKATHYCLIELIRNVFDHSGAKPVVCAQRMSAGRGGRDTDTIQVAVADCGAGLLATLKGMHKWVETDSMAIDAATTPYLSGTFPLGGFGQMQNNAGLGLYFVSELVKRSDGRFLIWSGEHLRLIVRDASAPSGYHVYSQHTTPLTGTTAVFEFELGLIDDYAEFFAHLKDKTAELTAGGTRRQVLRRTDDIPPDVPRVAVTFLREDTVAARSYRVDYLLPRVGSLARVCLDFRMYRYVSPSFSHALMYETVREAARSGCTLMIANVTDPVWDALQQVEQYALAAPQ